MIVTISSNSTPKKIEEALEKLRKNAQKEHKNHFDAHKFCGVIKFKEDPLAVQKAMRNEWQ